MAAIKQNYGEKVLVQVHTISILQTTMLLSC
ncbi:hypothetical protein CsSME_00051496 [Camellia sinensis var. sinensis]